MPDSARCQVDQQNTHSSGRHDPDPFKPGGGCADGNLTKGRGIVTRSDSATTFFTRTPGGRWSNNLVSAKTEFRKGGLRVAPEHLMPVLGEMNFEGVEPAATGRPSYHPSVLLKLYIYGYLNRVQSSRRLEREAGRNVEVMWLLGRLAPDHKTIADFRKDNGVALRKVCARFVELCREMGLLATSSVAIDGSKFKAVNNRDKNFTKAKVQRRRAQLEESVARYLSQHDTADRQEPTEALATKVARLTEKLTKLKEEMGKLAAYEKQMLASSDQQISLTDPDSRSMATSGRGSGVVGYNVQVAVDTEHHLIVAHEVTNSGSDRAQLANMAKQARPFSKPRRSTP